MLKYICILLLGFPFLLNAQTAFISGNDTICDNANNATVMVDFNGSAPFTFVYSVNGIHQPSITTQNTPYFISTSIAGTYTLQNFNDAISVGGTSGSAIVTVLQSPTAIINLASDTLSVIYPLANFSSQSIGNIVSWDWDFGDNTSNINTEDVSHMYSDSSALYNVALIIEDINGCTDTAISIVWIKEEYWMWIPNTFSPDNDLRNDKFCFEFNAIRENTFLFTVYNPIGEVVFQSSNPNDLKCCLDPPNCFVKRGWDGKHYKNVLNVSGFDPFYRRPYIYTMNYQDFEGWKYNKTGIITIIQ